MMTMLAFIIHMMMLILHAALQQLQEQEVELDLDRNQSFQK